MTTIALPLPPSAGIATCFISSNSSQKRFEDRRDATTSENRLMELEHRLDLYVRAILKHSLSQREFEELTTLSTDSLENIRTMSNILEQLRSDK